MDISNTWLTPYTDYVDRVVADGGTPEAISCLRLNILTPDGDTSWLLDYETTISGGVLTFDTSDVRVVLQDVGFVVGDSYEITYTISSYTSGSVTVYAGLTAGTSRSAAGTYTETITCSGDSYLRFIAPSGTVLSIDNVSAIPSDIDKTYYSELFRIYNIDDEETEYIKWNQDGILKHDSTDFLEYN